MKPLSQIVPNSQDLLSLKPEEIGGVILEYLTTCYPMEFDCVSRLTFTHQGDVLKGYDQQVREKVDRALMEGWAWLGHEGLIAPCPETDNDTLYYATRPVGRRQSQVCQLTESKPATACLIASADRR